MNRYNAFDLPELAGSDLRPALEDTAWTLLDLTGAEQVFVFGLRAESGLFDPLLALGSLSLPEKQGFWSTPLDPQGDALIRQIVEQQDALVISADERRQTYADTLLAVFHTRTFLVYPLANRGQVFGLILLGWSDAAFRPSDKQIQTVGSMARSISLAMDNARLYEMTSQQLRQVLILQQINQAILKKTELQEVLAVIAEEAVRLTGAMGCAIRLREPDRALEVAYQTGHKLEELAQDGARLKWEPEQVLDRRDPVLVPINADPDERVLLAIPLINEEVAFGLLEVYQRQSYLGSQDIQAVQAFANQAAIAIEHARLYRQAQKAAIAEERARLARDLHDSINQLLYATTLYARAAERQLSAGNVAAVRSNLSNIQHTAQDALGEIRMLIYELRPAVLDESGLAAALEQRLKMVEERLGFETELEADLPRKLPRLLEEALYRIAQEALNNVVKHSGAKHVRIGLEHRDAVVVLEIADDGRGFDQLDITAGGLGLKSMQERAHAIQAEFSIQSRPGGGTMIRVEAPYGQH
ncbi:MAG: GAF domain-containing sensor histidine kinase [Anaerolineaceae bacterium]|nr:GAF domain-containing sensor histidine kinase [Anaerolineaceae bacterium]